jgi:translation initiation factor 3 subunit E
MSAKLALLKPTNMADFAVEIYQTLHDTEDVPAEFEDRRGAILDALSYAKNECRLMLELIEDEEKIMQLQSENLLNAQYLEQNEGVRLCWAVCLAGFPTVELTNCWILFSQ